MAPLIWIFLATLIGLYISRPIMDPDLWWHIVVGRWILSNGKIPDVDYWNMFGVGQPWIPYSWSNEIIFAFIEKNWGVSGLLVTQSILGVLLTGICMYVAGRIGKDHFFGALLGIFIASASEAHLSLRPQGISWILLALMLFISDDIARNGISKKKLFFTGLLSCIWANSHLTAVLGVGMASLWAFGGTRSRGEDIKSMLSVFAAGFLGCLITPFFGAEMLTLISKANHPFSFSLISEFQMANISHHPVGILIIGLTLLLLFIHFKPTVLSAPRILVLGVTVIACLAVVKFLPMAAIVCAITLATLWRERNAPKGIFGNLGESFIRMEQLYSGKLKGPGFAVLLIAGILLQYSRLAEDQKYVTQMQSKAFDFIFDNKLSGPILNMFGDGGYLMYRLADADGKPSQLVAIDGRTNVNPPEIMAKFEKALDGQQGWKEYLDAVNPQTVIWKSEAPLVAILKEREDWKLVYQDTDVEKGHSVFQKVPSL
jgi:hypothetical protein